MSNIEKVFNSIEFNEGSLLTNEWAKEKGFKPILFTKEGEEFTRGALDVRGDNTLFLAIDVEDDGDITVSLIEDNNIVYLDLIYKHQIVNLVLLLDTTLLLERSKQ